MSALAFMDRALLCTTRMHGTFGVIMPAVCTRGVGLEKRLS